jgi:glycosyltransferase involved in cell wall biosynthesis
MDEPVPEAPRVTLVLIAFNQERYIDAAVEAALAQDYPNLEIILSDDHSTDATFDRMRKLAGAYRGPHQIILNQAPGGRGILAHVYHAVERSSGSLIVLAAGDDISYPNRVSRLVEAWQATEADALISGFDRIDEHGHAICRVLDAAKSEYDPSVYFDHGRAIQLVGYCAAYDRRLFDAIALPAEPVMAEDYFFSLVLGLRSRNSTYVAEPLVAYRVHDQAITHVGDVGIEQYEAKSAYTASMFGLLLRLVGRMAREGEGFDPAWGTPAKVDFRRLDRDAAYLEHRANWLSSSFPERLLALMRFRAGHQRRWMLPRLFGVHMLARLKRLRESAVR